MISNLTAYLNRCMQENCINVIYPKSFNLYKYYNQVIPGSISLTYTSKIERKDTKGTSKLVNDKTPTKLYVVLEQ